MISHRNHWSKIFFDYFPQQYYLSFPRLQLLNFQKCVATNFVQTFLSWFYINPHHVILHNFRIYNFRIFEFSNVSIYIWFRYFSVAFRNRFYTFLWLNKLFKDTPRCLARENKYFYHLRLETCPTSTLGLEIRKSIEIHQNPQNQLQTGPKRGFPYQTEGFLRR